MRADLTPGIESDPPLLKSRVRRDRLRGAGIILWATVGFLTNLRREFIARPDVYKGEVVFKWPDTNIRKQSQITVEQDELAVFFRDGTVRGILQPGVSTLDSSEIPFLGDLMDTVTGGNYFKTELYFVSTREFANLPFGGMVDNVLDPETQLAVGLRVSAITR
jgi:membrane protease subunit (stomatin/prohibitin family)